MGLPVKSLDNDVMQKAINEECKRKAEGRNGDRTLSPKTVINEYGLLNTALKKYHGVVFDITLPKQINKNVELPEPEEVAFDRYKDRTSLYACYMVVVFHE